MLMREGGAAFPVAGGVIAGREGMTLRDWFATAAAAGLVANDRTPRCLPELSEEDVALKAYRLADAMLRERGK